MDFSEIGISQTVIDILKDLGIAEPTPIQEKAIPEIMKGTDVIGKAQTGTGKTLAFLLPIIEKTDLGAGTIQSLIVTPTRELALQITAELRKIAGKMDDFEVLAVYGGQDVDQQMRRLKRSVSVVVATPGRLLDHIRRGTIDLSHVECLVLDEADQMLHIGFLPEVEEIISHLPDERQTLLFSATIHEQVRELAARFLKNPVTVSIKSSQITVSQIRQAVIETTDRAKQAALFKTIDEERPFMAIIFCRTKRRVSKLLDALKEAGYNADELHGDLSQAKRERVMKSFRDASIQLLVATDVAARGLDVEGVTHVFNYDVPEDAESYIHRIGRTGRAGEHGLAVTFIADKDLPLLKDIEAGIKMKIERKTLEGVKPAPPAPNKEKQKPKRRGTTAREDYEKRHGIKKEQQSTGRGRQRSGKGPQKSAKPSASTNKRDGGRRGR